LIYLLGSFVTLSVLDAVLTYFIISFNLGTEGNPFMAGIVGEPIFFVLKFFGALLAAFILWDITRKNRRLGLTATLGGVALYSLIVLWNMRILIMSHLA
jgi:hypothetical protein